MDFKDSHGNLLKGEESIFPIITKNEKGLFEFLATGFFIGFEGEFVTAKHVVLNNKNNNQPYRQLYIVQSIKGKHVIRFVEYIYPHPKSDIVFGKLHNIIKQPNGQKTKFSNIDIPFQLSIQKLKIKEVLKTFAFPNSKIEIIENKEIGSFLGEWFTGEVKEYYRKGRDTVFLPDSCYRTSINILGGSSGGPVINSQSKVVAINSSGYELIPDQENISFITPIGKMLEISICLDSINDTIENHLKQKRINLLL